MESMINIQQGQVQLLFASPESILCNPQWRELPLLPVYQEKMVTLVPCGILLHATELPVYMCSNRGDDFRLDYGRLGELRALIPDSVNVMALTATATKSSRHVPRSCNHC